MSGVLTHSSIRGPPLTGSKWGHCCHADREERRGCPAPVIWGDLMAFHYTGRKKGRERGRGGEGDREMQRERKRERDKGRESMGETGRVEGEGGPTAPQQLPHDREALLPGAPPQ